MFTVCVAIVVIALVCSVFNTVLASVLLFKFVKSELYPVDKTR